MWFKIDILGYDDVLLNVPKNIQLNRNHVITLLKEKIQQEHDKAWKESLKTKGKWYSQIQDEFPKVTWHKEYPYIDRRHITTIIRMRSGHCLTKEHLHKIGIKDSPYCECGQIQDINHIFLECPINRIPNLDIYRMAINKNICAPLSMTNILGNLDPSIIRTLIKYITHNKIDLWVHSFIHLITENTERRIT